LSDERLHQSNLEIVINNCYPLAVINRKLKERLLTIKKNSITVNEKTKDDNTYKVMVVLYVKEISNGIKRVMGKGIDVRFTIL